MTAAFFGHRDAPLSVRDALWDLLTDLVENENADRFYVGNHGDFDAMVLRCLEELRARYPRIRPAVVLAYLPKKDDESFPGMDTVYPEGLETVPPRFAIVSRNRWMIRNADTVIVYANRSYGNAYKMMCAAQRQGKRVINLAESLQGGGN